MNGSKPWYQSTSVIGSIVTLATLVLALFGVSVSEAQASQLADKLMLVGMGVGGVLSLVGRLKADKPIGSWRAEIQQLPAGQFLGFDGKAVRASAMGAPLAEGRLVGSPPPSQGGFARAGVACLLALLAALSLAACSYAPYGGSPPPPEKYRPPHSSEAAPASGSASATALAQAAGVLTAISNLPPAPADADTRAQIEGWRAWAGYLAPLVGTVASAAQAGAL